MSGGLLLAVLSCSTPRNAPDAPLPNAGGVPDARASAPASGNVAIIVLDACRADKMGCYGFGRPTTPNIDQFARDPDATVFPRHYVQGAWTKPSVASMFSGAYVKQHGVVLNHKDNKKKSAWRKYLTQVLSGDYDTLAERMKRLGFRTLGVVKSFHLDAKYGFSQGFDVYEGPDRIHSDVDRIDRFLDLASTPGAPFFAYVHLNACHLPFEAADRDADYMASFAVAYDEQARQAEGLDFTTSELVAEIKRGGRRLTKEDRAFLNLIYEAKMRRVDRLLVSRLLEGLKSRGLYDSTLILLTADHGEQLYDHESYGHGNALWEEVVHVPLIVKFPKGTRPAPAGVPGLTEAVDFLPAIVSWAGGPPDESLPGHRFLQGEYGSFVLGETKNDWFYTDGDIKAMGGRSSHLFRLSSDPLESDDHFAQDPATHLALTARIEAVMKMYEPLAHAPTPIEIELSPEEEKNLKSLGYLK